MRRSAPLSASCTAALLGLAVLATACPARAQQAVPPAGADDVLQLRDGTLLRGQIAERRPDGTTVIVLLTGEVRTIPGEEIASASTVPLAPPPPPAPPAPVSPAASFLTTSSFDEIEQALRTPGPGRVPLRVESVGREQSVGIALGRVAQPGLPAPMATTLYREVCQTPCTLHVRPGAFALWTGGNGVASITTQVRVPHDGTRVIMRAPSAAVWKTAPYVAAVGGAMMMTGGMILGMSLTETFRSDLGVGLGITGLAVGGVAAITGLVLLSKNPWGILRQQRLEFEPASRWSVGAAPLPGGAALAGAVQF
jgi:hypothetical protein